MENTKIINEKNISCGGIIEKYGYDPSYGGQGDVGRISSVSKGRFGLISEYGELSATVKSSVYYAGCDNEFPTVGDFVEFWHNEAGESKITRTLPRKTLLHRLDPSSKGKNCQLIAANVDYAFILTSANRDFNLRKIQRYLAVALGSGAAPVIVLSKTDLTDSPEDYIRQIESIAPEVAVLPVCAVNGGGVEKVKDIMRAGTTSVFLGSSGVGKSTLVNGIAGKTVMTTGGIRLDDDRGRHTTTSRQMILLDGGQMVIDTPGMREIGLWAESEGLEKAFVSISDLARSCRFSDCTHTKEPGCAVLEALKHGEISESDYRNFMKLRKEVQNAERALDSRSFKYDRKYLKNNRKKR